MGLGLRYGGERMISVQISFFGQSLKKNTFCLLSQTLSLLLFGVQVVFFPGSIVHFY